MRLLTDLQFGTILILHNDSLTNLQVIGLYYCTDDQQRRPLAKAEFERQVIDKID